MLCSVSGAAALADHPLSTMRDEYYSEAEKYEHLERWKGGVLAKRPELEVPQHKQFQHFQSSRVCSEV